MQIDWTTMYLHIYWSMSSPVYKTCQIDISPLDPPIITTSIYIHWICKSATTVTKLLLLKILFPQDCYIMLHKYLFWNCLENWEKKCHCILAMSPKMPLKKEEWSWSCRGVTKNFSRASSKKIRYNTLLCTVNVNM